VKQFSTECGLKRSWLHRFAGFLYSVYFIAQALDSIYRGSVPKKLILRCVLRDVLRRSNASKTEMICAGVDLTFAARANDVA
jgi:hypothetical protein